MNGAAIGRSVAAAAAGLMFLSTGALAAEEACPFLFYHPARERYTDAPSPEVCDSMRSYVPAFNKLLAAADFSEADIQLYGSIDPDDNAFYYLRAVYLNTGTIAAHPTSDAAMLYTLAHELGHAVQDRGGELAWKKDAPYGSEEWKTRSRKVEGQADHIAADLLEKAGLGGVKTALKGVEEGYSCPSIAAGGRGVGTHPSNGDRFLLQLKKATLTGAGAAAVKDAAAAFDGAGRRAPSSVPAPVPADRPSGAVFRPRLGLDDFDAYGRPKNQGLRTAAVPTPGPSAAGTLASVLTAAPFGALPALRPAKPAKSPGFWGGLADAVSSAQEAAVNAVLDFLWFDNPVVEALAVKSCGIPKEAGFNEAVRAGMLPWAASKAAEAAAAAKDLYAKATGEKVDLAFRPKRF
ncbi:hypothetical protein EPO15_03885 [bacterium]|nr:MAG: hypothetical protein EPO15_03885 [bacterium]